MGQSATDPIRPLKNRDIKFRPEYGSVHNWSQSTVKDSNIWNSDQIMSQSTTNSNPPSHILQTRVCVSSPQIPI